jgi:hypothetical protein
MRSPTSQSSSSDDADNPHPTDDPRARLENALENARDLGILDELANAIEQHVTARRDQLRPAA